MIRMNYYDFVRNYLPEIDRKSKTTIDDLPDTFPYDKIVSDDDGNPVKVIVVGDFEIPIISIIQANTEEEFRVEFPHPDCLEAFRLYLSNFEIIGSEEILKEVQNRVRQSAARIDQFSEKELSRWTDD